MAQSTDLGSVLGTILLQALTANAAPQAAAPATKPKKAYDGRPGYRGAAVVSKEEIEALVNALASGEEQKVVVGNRESVVEILDAEAAEKYKGGFRILRRNVTA